MSRPFRSIDQERAAFAWKRTDPQKVRGNYRDFANLASGAPALVMGNGLMQVLAFLNDKRHEHLLSAIVGWIGPRTLNCKATFPDVMQALHGTDADTYMRATEEALEILKWIRQLAKARSRE